METDGRVMPQKNGLLEETAKLHFQDPRKASLAEVIESSSKLINYFIKLYGCGHSREDLYQVGVEGLLKALQRYDCASGVMFTTYAGNCIMGEIRHYVRKEMSYYRPRIIERLQDNIESIIEKELSEKGDIPDMHNIADRLNIRDEGIHEVMRAGLAPLDEVDLSKISSQRLESFRLPVEDKIVLEQALNKLSELQKKVIYMLFYRDLTQQQAAEKLSINQRKVSRLLHSSLESMRTVL